MGKPWIVGVAITAVMALGMGTVAKANKVEFTTSGYFTVANPSSDVYVASGSLHLYGSTVSFTEGGGTFTVSNPNAGQTFNVSTSENCNDFGFFTWTGDAKPHNDGNNNSEIGTFTLVIHQTSPLDGSGSIDRILTQSVRKQESQTDQISILFDSAQSVRLPGLTPPNYTYTVKKFSLDKNGNVPSATAGLEGTILYTPASNTPPVPVPLPASAWMGMGLLGGIGAVRAVRRRKA